MKPRPNAPWHLLPEPEQLALTRAALTRAAQTIAIQAETLAAEMEAGTLADHGGPDALRLLAAVVRTHVMPAGAMPAGPIGHA